MQLSQLEFGQDVRTNDCWKGGSVPQDFFLGEWSEALFLIPHRSQMEKILKWNLANASFSFSEVYKLQLFHSLSWKMKHYKNPSYRYIRRPLPCYTKIAKYTFELLSHICTHIWKLFMQDKKQKGSVCKLNGNSSLCWIYSHSRNDRNVMQENTRAVESYTCLLRS